MKRFFLSLLCVAMTVNLLAIDGALPGAFTVNKNGDKIQFSKGNLQYQASTNTWRFAENQWDIIGEGNENISSTYDGWIDLFGWGTSGYNKHYPYMTTTDATAYGEKRVSIIGTNYDWGIYNPISNGGNKAGLWYTMGNTVDEGSWYYVLRDRTDAKKLWSLGTVNGICGLILLPDDWTLPSGGHFVPTEIRWDDYDNFFRDWSVEEKGFDNNKYTIDEWQIMEDAGAVFLPVAGCRLGNEYISENADNNPIGCYWTSSVMGSWYKPDVPDVTDYSGEAMGFVYNKVFPSNYCISQILNISGGGNNFYYGLSVRLVKEYKAPAFYTVTISQPEHGTVSLKETGIDLAAVEEGTLLHFMATPEEGYELDAWSGCAADGSLTVSDAATVTCTFKKQTFQVTFVDWDDAVLKPAQTVEWGEAALPPSDPVRVDYDFTGWDTDFSSVKSNLTVKAQYKEVDKTVYYTVTYYDWDLTLLGTEKVEEGHDAEGWKPEPTREGYDFTGWSKPLTNITADVNVMAQYEVAKTWYTVTYYDWDLTLLGTEKVEEGHDAEGWKPEPEREGYTFIGWSKPLTNITADVNVMAQYEVAKVWYTVTYYDWDLTLLGTEKVEEGHDAKGIEPDPEREGYTFIGWSKSLTNITSDLSVAAQYEVAKVWYTVTYYDWDLTLLGTEKVEEGHDAKGIDPDPEREGYTFIGWSKSLTNITSDLSVAAQYEKKEATAIDETGIRTTDDTRKFIENGVLYINRNGILYDAHGTRLD